MSENETGPATAPTQFRWMSREDYRARIAARGASIGGVDSWRLQLAQNIDRAGNASWEAFAREDWAAALGAMEAARASIVDKVAAHVRAGVHMRQVRVVEEPLTPYMQWDLRFLAMRAECGEVVSVVTREQFDAHPTAHFLPDTVLIGPDAMYHENYEPGLRGAELTGVYAYTGAPCMVLTIREALESLAACGEHVADYVARTGVVLPVPERAAG